MKARGIKLASKEKKNLVAACLHKPEEHSSQVHCVSSDILMPTASLNSTFSEVQVSATKHADQQAAFRQLKVQAMTTEESALVDEMLEDYRESRDAMCTLTCKLSQMAA